MMKLKPEDENQKLIDEKEEVEDNGKKQPINKVESKQSRDIDM